MDLIKTTLSGFPVLNEEELKMLEEETKRRAEILYYLFPPLPPKRFGFIRRTARRIASVFRKECKE